MVAIVDECDYGLVMRFPSWCARKAPTLRENYHARCHVNIDGRRWPIWLHRVILLGTGIRPPSKWHVIGDHIDGDGLNCQRANLRWNTRSGNAKNDPRYRAAAVSSRQFATFESADCHPDLSRAELRILRAADARAFAGAARPADVIKAAASYDLHRNARVDRASVEVPF